MKRHFPTKLRSPRRGAVLVEFAVVAPVALMLILMIMVSALAVFRYHEIASVTREAARWASVRGGGYAYTTGKPAVTADDISNYVKTHTHSLNGAAVTVQFTANNTIIVESSYVWKPEVLGLSKLIGPITMKSRSEVPKSF
jgi:Flp pilus assembly protein TadG